MRIVVLSLSLTLYCVFPVGAQPQDVKAPSDPVEHEGIYDASGAVPLSESLFVVGNDEDNVLRVYDRSRPRKPTFKFDVTRHLDLDPKRLEVDIEGTAQSGDRVYWISSHGTSRDGGQRLERRRFFATRFTVADGDVRMEFVGKPCKTLLDDMLGSPRLAKYDLAEAAKLAPSKNGLNIEGLAATSDGNLLIGLRGPLARNRRAVVIPLVNPEAVIEGKTARFGEPLELDLGGLGIRGLEYCSARKEYVVIAGPQALGACRIYRWSGRADDAPKAVNRVNLDGWCPETCVVYPGKNIDRIQIISDDGDYKPPSGPPRFRSGWVKF